MTPHHRARFVPAVEQLGDRIVPSLLTTRASTKSDGSQLASQSGLAQISDNGRFVAFSTSESLVAEDSNAVADIYLRDRTSGAVTLVSRADGVNGAIGNGSSASEIASTVDLSADGRYVLFGSEASNLVAGDTNGQIDVFVRDTVAGTTSLVSRPNGSTTDLSNASSFYSRISADGRFVTFTSEATNLVAGDTNGSLDVFLRNVTTNETLRVSANASGVQGNDDSLASALSADGRYVAFASGASNLIPNDTGNQVDVYFKDTLTNTVTRVSLAADGTRGNGGSGLTGFFIGSLDMSSDGRYVVFSSVANNLVSGDTNGSEDVFLRDVWGGTTTRMNTDANGNQAVSVGQQYPFPSISGNGRYVGFNSEANNLVANDTNGTSDAFIKDRITGAVTRVNVAADGTQGNTGAYLPSISRTGEFVAFLSVDTNLVAGDTNGVADVFVVQRPLPAVYAVGSSTGAVSQVAVYNGDGGTRTSQTFAPYPGFTGGTFVSLGDLTGDGIDDLVTSTGPGGTAHIVVYDGSRYPADPRFQVASFFGYPPQFFGGVNVDVGDVNGDGVADIACGVGVGGGPNIRVFDGVQIRLGNYSLEPVANGGALIHSFFAYPEAFTGGVRVAVADVNGDGFADVVCAVGSGGGPNIRVFDGKQMTARNFTLDTLANGGVLIASFFGLPETFTGGMFVSAGDFDNNGLADILVGVENGGGPNVRLYNGTTGAILDSKFAFDQSLTGGVRVASTDQNQDGYDDLVVGTGPGTGNQVKILSGKDRTTVLQNAFAPFAGLDGVNVG